MYSHTLFFEAYLLPRCGAYQIYNASLLPKMQGCPCLCLPHPEIVGTPPQLVYTWVLGSDLGSSWCFVIRTSPSPPTPTCFLKPLCHCFCLCWNLLSYASLLGAQRKSLNVGGNVGVDPTQLFSCYQLNWLPGQNGVLNFALQRVQDVYCVHSSAKAFGSVCFVFMTVHFGWPQIYG